MFSGVVGYADHNAKKFERVSVKNGIFFLM